MARKKRPRSEAQKAHRRAIERLTSLRKKVEEFNALTKGQAGIVWSYLGETSTFGDQQLLEILQNNTGAHHPFRQEAIRNSTSSPTNSTSSASSHDGYSRTPPTKHPFKNERTVDPGSAQQKPLPATPGYKNAPRIWTRWKKEDLGLLAVDFFGD